MSMGMLNESQCGGGDAAFAEVERALSSAPALSSVVAPLFAAGLLALPRAERANTVTSLPQPLSGLVREHFKGLRASRARLDAARQIAALVPLSVVLAERPASVHVASAMLLAATWGVWRSMLLSRVAPSGEWLGIPWNTDPQQASLLATWWEAELRRRG